MMELLITITIAAILVSLAVPAFNSTIGVNRLATQTNDLVGAMNFARSEAITRNANHTFCRVTAEASTACAASAAQWTFWVVRNEATGTVSRRGAVNLYNGAIRVSSSLTQDRIWFSSDGLARRTLAGALVNDTMTVCTTVTAVNQNRRVLSIGATSRLSIAQSTGCP
jgi:type IV fimbrial biogenesis protein FimT